MQSLGRQDFVHMFVQEAKRRGDVFSSSHDEGWIGAIQAARMFGRVQEGWWTRLRRLLQLVCIYASEDR